jgi:thiol-disulfide isomerase/thioredoxin
MGRTLNCWIIFLLILTAGCTTGPEETPMKTQTPSVETPSAIQQVEDSGTNFEDPVEFVNLQWVNSEPLKIEDLKGRVVLIEFWNRFCMRCQRLHPDVLLYHNKYSSDGLVILAIHVPALPEGKDPEFFKGVVEELNIEYPVALDNNYENWNNYGVEYTGTFFLIDKQGKVRYTIGIGEYDTLEGRINELLAE